MAPKEAGKEIPFQCSTSIPGLSQEDANDAIRSVISSHAELSSLRDIDQTLFP